MRSKTHYFLVTIESDQQMASGAIQPCLQVCLQDNFNTSNLTFTEVRAAVPPAEITTLLEELIEWEAYTFGGSTAACWRTARKLLKQLRQKFTKA